MHTQHESIVHESTIHCHDKYLVGPPLALITASHLLGKLSYNVFKRSNGTPSHAFFTAVHRLSMEVGFCSSTLILPNVVPEVLNWVQVWGLCRPRHHLNLLLLKALNGRCGMSRYLVERSSCSTWSEDGHLGWRSPLASQFKHHHSAFLSLWSKNQRPQTIIPPPPCFTVTWIHLSLNCSPDILLTYTLPSLLCKRNLDSSLKITLLHSVSSLCVA